MCFGKQMRKLSNVLILVLATYLFSGCAHKISITPDTDSINRVVVDNKIDANVAYYMSQDNKMKEIITPGGGGDKITYSPYKDTEAAFRFVLLKLFDKVYSLDSLDDKTVIQTKNIKYIFIPTINTTSFSDSIFTWPPTKFTFELRCYALDKNSNEIWSDIIYSEGYASYDEFKNNFGLSAQRASKQAMLELLEKIDRSKKFNSKEGTK